MGFWKDVVAAFTGKSQDEPKKAAAKLFSPQQTRTPLVQRPDLSVLARSTCDLIRLRVKTEGLDVNAFDGLRPAAEEAFVEFVNKERDQAAAAGRPYDFDASVSTFIEAYIDVVAQASRRPVPTSDPSPAIKPKPRSATKAARPRKVIDQFVAIDVETANRERHSICQIGVVLFERGKEVAAEKVLVDPRQEFGEAQMRVHGIRQHHVAGQPCFAEHYAWLARWIDGHHVVSHTDFDRHAIGQACGLHGVAELDCRWHDSWAEARKAWPDLPNHKLGTLAEACGIVYDAHDALADARVAGHLFYHAKIGSSIDTVRELLATPARARTGQGPLSGQCVTFTNDFDRPEAHLRRMAIDAGATISERMSKKNTTILVVGAHGRRAEWGEKSKAQQDAERWVAEGKRIRILSEAEFELAIGGGP